MHLHRRSQIHTRDININCIGGLRPVEKGTITCEKLSAENLMCQNAIFVTIQYNYIFADINRTEFAFARIDSAESRLSNGAKTSPVR